MMGHNKLIGGVFLKQKRGKRQDERFCTGRFSLFYPACYSEEPDIAPFGTEYKPELDDEFQESLVVQSSLGKSTQEEVCAELALGGDGMFCVKCLEPLESVVGGVTKTLNRFQDTGDCGQCYEQCVLLVGPNDDKKLTDDEVCGLCTYQDTSSRSFSTVGNMDWLTPPVTVNYLGGLLDATTGQPNPTQIYGWDAKAPGAVNIHIVASKATAPHYLTLMRDVANAMGLAPEADGKVSKRLRPHLQIHMVQPARFSELTDTDGRPLAGEWEDGSNDIPGVSAFWSSVVKEHVVVLHVLKGTDPTPVEAIDRLVDLWRVQSTSSDSFQLAGTDILKVVSDHSVCTQDRTSCLATTCEVCLDDIHERGEDLTKIERECSSFFSGGPLETEDGERYDCAVRLGGGDTATSLDGDGRRFGRVEVKNGNTWGTICSTGWDNTDADVLCKSIGYEGGIAKTVATTCEESERDDWCLTPASTVGTKAVASVDAAANTITLAPTCTADDPSTPEIENGADSDLIAACSAVNVNAATARADCLGTEACVETAAGSASSNTADAAACASVPLTFGANYGTQCADVGTVKTCTGTPAPARPICAGWETGGTTWCFDAGYTQQSDCPTGCTWLPEPTCAETFAASATCDSETGSDQAACRAVNGIANTRTSCEAAASTCVYYEHTVTRDRGSWLTGTTNWDGTPTEDCPPGCAYNDDDNYDNSNYGSPTRSDDDSTSISGVSGYIGESPSACTHTPKSGCFFTTAAGICEETATVPVAADTAACAAVIDPTSATAATCVRDDSLSTAAADATACTAVTGNDLASSAACAGVNSADGMTQGVCTYTAAQSVKQVCESVQRAAAGGGSACTYTDGIAAAIATGQTLTLASADGKTCAATTASVDLTVTTVSGAVVSVSTDITATDPLASEHCVLTASQCESTSDGRVDYAQKTKAAGSTCNLKIVARAGLFGAESRWQLDPHLDGPTGGFSADMEETIAVYDFLTPGVHKLKVTDSGKDGWQPLWERDLVPVYPECEEFWKYQVGDCRLCVNSKPAATCTGSPAGLDCAAMFAAASDSSAASCPTGCTYVSPYTQCEEQCQTCASPCTGHADRETCEAVTWNANGNRQGNRCVAWDWWTDAESTDAAAVTACAGADLSGPDPESEWGAVAMSCMDAGSNSGVAADCRYEPAVNMCEWSGDNGCVDFDPCPYSEDGVCDIGMAGDWRCMAGDWQDCNNPLLCDIEKGEACNGHLDSAGADATAGSIQVVDRVCTTADNDPCGDPSVNGCTCTDGEPMLLQWIHEGLNNDPDSSQWSYQGEVTCGSCPGNKYFPGGLGCDMQGALDENRWTCYGAAGCSTAFSAEDATTQRVDAMSNSPLPQVDQNCPTDCTYERIGMGPSGSPSPPDQAWRDMMTCTFDPYSLSMFGMPSAIEVETMCNALNAGRCVFVPSTNTYDPGHCDTCQMKRTGPYETASARNSAECAGLDQCAFTPGFTDSAQCAIHSSDTAGGGSNDACDTSATTASGCCSSNYVLVSCTGTASNSNEICDTDPSTSQTSSTDHDCPSGCAMSFTCNDMDGDTCMFTSAGQCNPAPLETPGTAAVSWRGSGGTCPCMPTWTETTCAAPYGPGEMGSPVWLADVHCTGSEDSLCSCKQSHENGDQVAWGAGLWLCDNSHALDAGVECFGVQQTQPERIQDCEGVCVPASVKGDGWCDEGEFNAEMNCQQLDCDGGDCSVGCQPSPTKCAAGKWACENGVCIEGSQRCDNIPQCGGGDKSDEEHCGDVFCCEDGLNCIPNAWRNDGVSHPKRLSTAAAATNSPLV
jgi:hypothetical protein